MVISHYAHALHYPFHLMYSISLQKPIFQRNWFCSCPPFSTEAKSLVQLIDFKNRPSSFLLMIWERLWRGTFPIRSSRYNCDWLFCFPIYTCVCAYIHILSIMNTRHHTTICEMKFLQSWSCTLYHHMDQMCNTKCVQIERMKAMDVLGIVNWSTLYLNSKKKLLLSLDYSLYHHQY